jgi:carbonic anhydrase
MAAILACADSRAPVELIFDSGFGDIFVIQAAGAVPGTDQVGSLEYAVSHLHVSLIVVLGHTKCGAIAAALSHHHDEGEAPCLSGLISKLIPAVNSISDVEENKKPQAVLEKSVELIQNEILKLSPIISKYIKEGKCQIIGAIYEIESGKVIFKKIQNFSSLPSLQEN